MNLRRFAKPKTAANPAPQKTLIKNLTENGKLIGLKGGKNHLENVSSRIKLFSQSQNPTGVPLTPAIHTPLTSPLISISDEFRKKIENAYKNIESSPSYSGSVSDILQYLKLSVKYKRQVQAVLNEIRSFSLHKKKTKPKFYRKTFVPGMFHTVQSDLVDYSKFKSANSHYQYILVVIGTSFFASYINIHPSYFIFYFLYFFGLFFC